MDNFSIPPSGLRTEIIPERLLLRENRDLCHHPTRWAQNFVAFLRDVLEDEELSPSHTVGLEP